MHVQIVTFDLGTMSEGEYIDVASRLAPRFAGLPGLLAKLWLESPESGVYGAIYLWEDQEAMDRFMASDLFEGTNRAFGDVVSDDFAVLENLTRATQPVLTLLEERAPIGRAPARPAPAPAAPEAFPKKIGPRKAAASSKAAPAKAAAPKAKARVSKVTAPTAKAPRTRKTTR